MSELLPGTVSGIIVVSEQVVVGRMLPDLDTDCSVPTAPTKGTDSQVEVLPVIPADTSKIDTTYADRGTRRIAS